MHLLLINQLLIMSKLHGTESSYLFPIVKAFVVTPPLSRDGGTA